MSRTKFNKCLNLEPKIYNASYSSLIGASLFGLGAAVFYGLMWGFAGFFLGFFLGKFIGKCWWSGQIQRWVYWNLPYFLTSLPANSGKLIPPSRFRKLL